MKTLKIAIPAAALALTSFAAAAQDQWYSQPQVFIGGGVGYNWLNGQPFRDPNNGNPDFNASHTTWKGLAGLRFSRMWSLEGQYLDFGAHNSSTDNVKATGWTTDIVLDLPVTPGITPFAKAGALFWNSDGTYTSTGGPLNGTGFNQSGTDFTWGGGVRFALAPQLDLRLEYERFRLDSAHVDNATASLQFNF